METTLGEDAYFRDRLRSEREHRGWTQTDLAKMLSDNGITGMYKATIAKIESGDRGVKLHEAAAIASLLGVSVDALLGRTASPANDVAFLVRTLRDTASAVEDQVMGAKSLMRIRLADVYLLDFEGREELQSECKRAFDALTDAQKALHAVSRFRLSPEVEAEGLAREHEHMVESTRKRIEKGSTK